MIADLIAVGIFSAQTYSTPPARSLLLPGVDVNRAPLPCPYPPPKYPDEIIDYQIDWRKYLIGDTIKASRVAPIAGDAVPSRMIFNDTTTSFFVSGGTSGQRIELACEIDTVVGRTFEFILALYVL